MDFLDLTLPTLAENLALDEALLLEAEDGRGGEVLRVWEWPTPAVVLGAAGVVADDVDAAACAADGVPRRGAAGGVRPQHSGRRGGVARAAAGRVGGGAGAAAAAAAAGAGRPDGRGEVRDGRVGVPALNAPRGAYARRLVRELPP